MITTLSLLPDATEDDDMEIVSKTKEFVDDHPRIVNRVGYLQDRMFRFEKDFQQHYEVKGAAGSHEKSRNGAYSPRIS